MSAPLVVSIGMTHPQNVAGLGVDVRVAADYGVRHAMVVAAVSAQDDNGVSRIYPLPRDVVLQQIKSAKMRDAFVRVGAVGTVKHLELLEGWFCGEGAVIDPVMRSSAGGSLYVDDAAPVLAQFSGGVGTIITPNIEEAQILTGVEIRTVDDMIAAGKKFLERFYDGALIKGGHLAGDPVDVLVTEDGVETFAGSRLPQRMRGTGCTLAMALACELALGRDLTDSVRGARDYLRAKLSRS